MEEVLRISIEPKPTFWTYRPWSILYNGTTTLFSESLARSLAKTGFMIYRIFFHEPEMYFVEYNHPFLRPLRILAMVIMIVVGLVLLPSYNGALFSFFYVPFLGKPIDSLTELHKKMQEANHSVGKKHSLFPIITKTLFTKLTGTGKESFQ